MAKTKKGKLPKRIGGVKLPKDLRKKGDRLIAQAQTPAGRAALAQGASVVAGIAATALQQAAAKKATRRAAPPPPAEPAAGRGPARPSTTPDAVADLVGAGVDALLGRLFPKR